MNMKKIAAVGAIALVGLGLTGCNASGTPDSPRKGYNASWFDTGDGRVIWCLTAGHAMSCDWTNAK